MGGRNFDAEADEDWLRLGAVLGRLHAVGGIREAPARLRCDPEASRCPLLRGLLDEGLVHPDLAPNSGALRARHRLSSLRDSKAWPPAASTAIAIAAISSIAGTAARGRGYSSSTSTT